MSRGMLPIPRSFSTTRALVDLWARPDSQRLLRFAHDRVTHVYRQLGIVVVEPEGTAQ